MDLSQYNALSDAEKAALTKGMESFDEIARNGDTAWVIEGIAAIKKEIKEWHKPSEAEMELWRAGAVKAWKDAGDTYDVELAERALAEQGLDGFIAKLKKAGAL